MRMFTARWELIKDKLRVLGDFAGLEGKKTESRGAGKHIFKD